MENMQNISEEIVSQDQSVNVGTGKTDLAIRFLDKIISSILLILFFGFPIFYTGMTLQGVVFEKQIFFYFLILLGAVSWVVKGVFLGELKIRKTPLDIALLVFLAAYIASAVFSVDAWHSIWGSFADPSRGVLNIIALVVGYYFIVNNFSQKRLYWILGALASSAFVIMIWMALTVFGVNSSSGFFGRDTAFTLFGSITAMMVFLGSMLPIFIVILVKAQDLFQEKSTLKKVVSVFAALGIMMALSLLFVLYSYTSWIAIVVGFVFLLAYAFSHRVKFDEKWLWLPMLVLVLLLLLYMVGRVQHPLVNFPDEARPNMKLSIEIMKGVLGDRMFFGSGPGTYSYDFSLYRPQEYNLQPLNALRFSQGAGFVFESVSTMGIIGALAVVFLVLSYINTGAYLLAQKKDSEKLISLGLWSSFVVMFIASLFIPVSGPLLILMVLIGVIGLMTLMQETASEESYYSLPLRFSAKTASVGIFISLIAVISVVSAFIFLGKAFRADVFAAQALKVPADKGQGVDLMTKASHYMPRESHYKSYLAQMYIMLASLEANKAEGEKNEDTIKTYIEKGNTLMIAARDMVPNDIETQEGLAKMYDDTMLISGVNADLLDNTQKAYEQAIKLEPHNPLFYVKLGQIHRGLAEGVSDEERKKKLDEAKGFFQKSIDEDVNFVAAYLALGLIEESLGNTDNAIATLSKGAGLGWDTKDAIDIQYNLARLLRIRGQEEDLKTAEALLKELVQKDDKNLNAYLNLGLVYEQWNRKEDAIQTYQKALDILQGDRLDAQRKQVQTFIDTVKAGKKNNVDEIISQKNPSNTEGDISQQIPKSIK